MQQVLKKKVKIGVVQMLSTNNVEENMTFIKEQLKKA